MSTPKEPISIRTTRLNNLILGHSKATSKTSKIVADGLNRECVLDALVLLYNECNKEQMKKRDKHILEFVSKFRPIIRETHSLRVNYDDFKVRALIGKGYFGDVYLVKEKTTGDIYAMKKIKKSVITTTQIREERDIMARHESEWITTLQYAFQDCDNLYLIMEYLPGGDMLSLMSRTGAFDEDLAKFYLAELTLAINALHCMGYVHRDIKPENILIDRFGHIKLADFGNAAALNKDGNVTSLSPVGTPDYIAPELLQTISSFKLSKSVHDVTCDYWSMGIIGFEMLCEITPFHEDNVHDTYSKILSHCDDGEPQVLRYPPEVILSSKFRHLIEGLVTRPNKRLTYLQILRHPFFEGIDWDDLRQIVPPIIPTLNGEDDISNFEDVEKVKGRRSTFVKKTTIGSVQPNDFSGNDLPFLGYGFIHEALAEESRSISGSESQIRKLNNKVKELQKTHKQQTTEIKILQDGILGAEKKVAESDSLNKILRDAKEELNNMNEILKEKTIELAASKREIKTLKSSLKIQEEMRDKNEIKISEVLTSINQKWEKAKMVSDQNYEKKIAEKKTEISNITQKLSVCENELSTKYEECTHLQEKIENYKEMLKSVKEKSNSDKIEFEKNKNQLIEAYESKLLEVKSKLRLEKDSRYKLSDELRDVRSELDESICSTNSNRQAKLVTQKNIEDMKDRLTKEIEENKNLRSKNVAIEKKQTDLKKVCESLRNEIERLNKDNQLIECKRKFEQEAASAYQTAHGSLSDLSQIEEQLRNDLLTAKENEDVQRKRADQLEKAVNRLEEMISKLSEQPKSVGDMLEKQNEKLEDKLASVREQCVVERQSARTANLSLWKMEKQVEDLTNDKKLIQRRMELTEEKIKKVQNDKDDVERKLKDSSVIIKQKEAKITELRDDIKNLKTDLQKEHKMWEKAEQERMKEKSDVLDHISHAHKLEEKLEDSRQKLMQINVKNDSFSLENKRLMRELKEERESNATLNEDLAQIQMQLKSSQDNYEMLKVACEITDSQLTELEEMLEGEVNRNKANLEKIDTLWKTIREKEDEIAKLRKLLNKEESSNNTAGAEIRNLKCELDEVKQNFDMIHKQLVSQQEQLIEKTSTLFKAQEKIEILSSDTSNMQTINENHNKEIIILKEENSRILTELFIAKESGQKLDRELKQARDSINDLQQENQQLNGTLSEQKNFFTQRDIKAEATLAQHKKLIDYLQQKVEELSKRKKCLVEKIFGPGTGGTKKENVAPNSVEYSTAYRTLQEELRKERERNNQLKDQLSKTKTDIQPVNASASPTKERKQQISDESERNMFESTRAPSLARSDTSSSGSSRRRTYQTHRFELTMDSAGVSNPVLFCIVCQVQILPGNAYWRCKECASAVHRKCRGGVQTSCDGMDIQKNFANTGSDRTSIMSRRSQQSADQLSEQMLLGDYTGKLIFKGSDTSPALQINCLYQITDDTILLGCTSGLFAYHFDNRTLVHIAGIENVKYIAVTKTLSKSILVGEGGEFLYQCDLRHLQNRSQANACLKPKLEASILDLPFANRGFNEKWHLASISKETDSISEAVAIAATSTRIVIMRYDIKLQRFKPVRALDTATAVTSILFTRHTAIVSSDKFFEIDLKSYSAEEFLDMSDTSLAHTRSCQPVSAFKISAQEFLLCFNEFGIFVDEYGCRSRPYDLNWEYTPTGFMYCEPLLFISHFQLLQVLRIHRSYTNEAAQQTGSDDEETSHLRAFINLNMTTILSKCGKLSVYATAVEKNTDNQELLIVDGAKALKSNTNVSLETLSSQATCLTLDSATSSSKTTDTL